jgi:hypothetical protein
MRKVMIATAGAAVLLAVVASIGSAGAGPRLNGTFAVTGTVQDSDYVPAIPPGTKTNDIYRFKSRCASGACARVKLNRDAGGRHIRSTLHKTAPRRYRGTEGPQPYLCVDPIGDPGQFTSTHTIRVTRARNGHATRFSGQIKIRITGCTETFENVAVEGKLRG